MDPAEAPASRAAHVLVYGNDHSPWVQAVLLGLHEREIPNTNVLAPPLDLFLSSGVLMPAARLDGAPWLLDSARILGELGFSELAPADRRALGAVFLTAAMRRMDHPWTFWRRFSLVGDGARSRTRRCWNQFWRAFSIFYFSVLIPFGRRGSPPSPDEQIAQEFAVFQDRFAPGATFLGGDAPDTVDFQLFGQVQMCASIPGRAYVVLQEDPSLERLRTWIAAMQRRFADYSHLHSAGDFDAAGRSIDPASAAERVCFWAGAALMWLAFPITVPLVFFFVTRIRRKGLQRG